MLKPNFLIAYSNVYFSIHIQMIQEMSSFANQFFNLSPLPSHVEPALVGPPANQKQGGKAQKSVKLH